MSKMTRLACNIDARGRWWRAAFGAVLLLGGVVLALLSRIWPLWLVAGALGLGGLFALFEAAVGWCAARALGFRTPT